LAEAQRQEELRKQQEEEARRKAEEEAARKKAEEEAAKRKAINNQMAGLFNNNGSGGNTGLKVQPTATATLAPRREALATVTSTWVAVAWWVACPVLPSIVTQAVRSWC